MGVPPFLLSDLLFFDPWDWASVGSGVWLVDAVVVDVVVAVVVEVVVVVVVAVDVDGDDEERDGLLGEAGVRALDREDLVTPPTPGDELSSVEAELANTFSSADF
jgi:hypothetical protein